MAKRRIQIMHWVVGFAYTCSLTSCYQDKAETLYPKNQIACVEQPTYSIHVAPLIQNQCLACHSTTQASALGGNLVLEGYDKLTSAIDRNVPVLASIEHQEGVSRMPKNGNKLSACDIEIVRKWISNGKLNN